jgi:hypothetical protein
MGNSRLSIELIAGRYNLDINDIVAKCVISK